MSSSLSWSSEAICLASCRAADLAAALIAEGDALEPSRPGAGVPGLDPLGSWRLVSA